MARKTTSLKVDEELWKKVKIRCIEEDIEISSFIEKIIQKKLEGDKKR